ncbi:MAG: NUDIX domain-containing protein [Chloroflexota bacterium]
MPDELFDIVTEEDVVLYQAPRSVAHAQGLWHRGVHVLLFDRDGRLLVQQRSRTRTHAPLTLDCSISEHVQAGETYLQAAVRGLAEELGVSGLELQPLIKFKMNYGPNDNEISLLYRSVLDLQPLRFDPEEVERVDFLTLAELQGRLTSDPAAFSYWFAQILRWLLGQPSALQPLDIPQK